VIIRIIKIIVLKFIQQNCFFLPKVFTHNQYFNFIDSSLDNCRFLFFKSQETSETTVLPILDSS